MLSRLIDAVSLRIDGTPVWVKPWLQYHVQVKFRSDMFEFWGGTPLTFQDGDEFLSIIRASMQSGQFHLGELRPLRIYMGWELYWKLKKALEKERAKKAVKTN